MRRRVRSSDRRIQSIDALEIIIALIDVRQRMSLEGSDDAFQVHMRACECEAKRELRKEVSYTAFYFTVQSTRTDYSKVYSIESTRTRSHAVTPSVNVASAWQSSTFTTKRTSDEMRSRRNALQKSYSFVEHQLMSCRASVKLFALT